MLLCIVQTCLLLLVSVLPQIHVCASHGNILASDACPEADTCCPNDLSGTHGQEPQQSNPDEEGTDCYPIVLFEENAEFSENTINQLFQHLNIIAFVGTTADVVWKLILKGDVQARAPPTIL